MMILLIYLFTGPLLRQAYLEALYHADDWEYERMTTQYWQRLIFEVSETASLEPMLRRHPMTAEDQNFTRPLVPYDCALADRIWYETNIKDILCYRSESNETRL